MPKAGADLDFGLQYNGEDIPSHFTIPPKFHYPAIFVSLNQTVGTIASFSK